MSRAKRIEPVQDMIEDAERRLAMSVASFETRVKEAETKLQELQRYRLEYQQQFSQRAGRGMGATDLRDYQAFLARLDEAIRQQQTLLQRVQAERDVERQKWQKAAIKAKALDHVVDKWRAEERRSQDQRDQRDSDERGQRVKRDEVLK
jgi:flagellar FliJ protein